MTQNLVESILLSLLHSIWQLAILFLVYKVISLFFLKHQPLARRNLLFVVLGLQFLVSTISFIYFYNQLSVAFTFFPIASSWPLITGNSFIVFTSFYCYLAIVGIKSVRLLVLQQKENLLFSNSLSIAPDFLQEKLSKLSTGFRQTVRICITETAHILSPFVYGFIKPTIVFPVALINALGPEETEALLLHELAHIRNNDYLLNLLLCLAEIIYFFNPFVYILSSELKLEREKACDAYVLENGIGEKMYALTLYKIALPFAANKLALSATGDSKHLLKRIHTITRQEKTIGKPKFRRLALAGFAIIFAVFLGFTQNKIERTKSEPSNDLQVYANATLLPFTQETQKIQEKILPITSEAMVEKSRVETQPMTENLRQDVVSQGTIVDQQSFDLPVAPLVNGNHIISLAAYQSDQHNNQTQVIYIEEENSQGQKTLTAVKVTLAGDSIITTPMWQFEKIIISKDSALLIDSSKIMH